MMSHNVIFMGTPQFSCPILLALHESYHIVCVVTQPDQPSGRGMKVTPCPVKQQAQQLNLPIISPPILHTDLVYQHLEQLAPDFIIVAAYGKILKPRLLQLPRYGCINVHASLLPFYRGASPISSAIEAGDQQTGITIMHMEQQMDAGPILEQAIIEITPQDTTASLSQKLSHLGAQTLIDVLPKILNGNILPQEQDHTRATFCHKLDKAARWLDAAEPADILERKIRAHDPFPGSCISLGPNPHELLIIKKARIAPGDPPHMPAGTLFLHHKQLLWATQLGCLELMIVQKPGKNPVTGLQWTQSLPKTFLPYWTPS